MFTTFAHAGHSHDEVQEIQTASSVSTTGVTQSKDAAHCTPVYIGAGLIIAVLLAIIAYMFLKWQPKSVAKSIAKKATKKTKV